MNILLVDDESAFREVMEEFLAELGHDVVHADNGKEAIKVFQAPDHTFDLLITDFMMPSIDGLRLIHLVREINQDIPILMISAHALFEVQDTIASMNVTFFEKPVHFDTLDAYLNSLRG